MTPIRSAILTFSLAIASPAIAAPWTFDTAAQSIRDASCGSLQSAGPFSPLRIQVERIDAGTLSQDGVSLAGAWVLQSDNRVLGGLSGLSLAETGDLLAVTDVGRFIRIGMTDVGPSGIASFAPMRFENPLIRPGKLTADAEGLDYRDGIALVSFERHFRVLGFDLRTCGADAKGVTIAKPPKRYEWQKIRANSGPEALMLNGDGTVTIGYEQPRNDRAVTATLRQDATADLSDPAPGSLLPPDFRLVGLDHLTMTDGDAVTATLLRAYDRESGNRNIISLTSERGRAVPTVKLQAPMEIDNFEGITLQDRGNHLRAYIISDDNFSDRQQTLLYAIDWDWPDRD